MVGYGPTKERIGARQIGSQSDPRTVGGAHRSESRHSKRRSDAQAAAVVFTLANLLATSDGGARRDRGHAHRGVVVCADGCADDGATSGTRATGGLDRGFTQP